MTSFNSYLLKAAVTFFVLLALTASFNLLVDPFELFNSPKFAQFNQKKPLFHAHDRMIKANRMRQWQPDVIVMGSSRAEIGLNPDNTDLLKTATPAFNLAISGANIHELLRYLQHAQHLKPLKQVVVGLDFFMFNINKPNEPDFNDSRLAPNSKGYYVDLFQSLLTYDALEASIKTINQQHTIPESVYLPNGFRDDRDSWSLIQKVGGHRQAAINNERHTLAEMDGYVFFAITDKSGDSSSLESFEQLLVFCKDNKIDLHLFISPEHARKLVLLNHVGLWAEFASWKQHLVRIIAENAPEFSLWDFSGFNSITTEAFPALGDSKTQMHGYWESSHYKKEIGNIILHKLLTADNSTPPADFGVLLTPLSIGSQLQNAQSQRDAYINANPDILVDIENMLTATEADRNQLIKLNPKLSPLAYYQTRAVKQP